MSDTVEASIIGAIGVVLAAVVGLLAHRRKTQHQSPHISNEPTVTPPSIPNASHDITGPVPRRTIDLSHKQIADAITAVPPLQQDGIEASFIGVYVHWRGGLSGASRIHDHVQVSLSGICEKGGLVICTAAPEDCVNLLIAPADTRLVVHGRIESVGEFHADLEDCTFELPQNLQPNAAPELQTRVSELERRMDATPAEQFAEKVRRATEDFKNEQPKK